MERHLGVRHDNVGVGPTEEAGQSKSAVFRVSKGRRATTYNNHSSRSSGGLAHSATMMDMIQAGFVHCEDSSSRCRVCMG